MIYRLVIKLLGHIKQPLMYKFAYLYNYFLCKGCWFLPVKRSLARSPVEVMGLSFANPIGLAAGFDRQGKFLRYSAVTGLGFIEIGTINIDANQDVSNLTRYLANADRHFKNSDKQQLWGVNLGSLSNDLNAKTVLDYSKGMALFWHYADYFVINLSRPESPTRRSNLDIEKLTSFLTAVKQQHTQLTTDNHHLVPVVVKIAIDYQHNEHTITILSLVRDLGFDGVIIAFENWPDITKVCDFLRVLKSMIGFFPLLVVGGIRSVEDAQQVLAAGASLVQIYTSLVQQGASAIRKMVFKLS